MTKLIKERIKMAVSLRSGVEGISDAVGTYGSVLAVLRRYQDSSFAVTYTSCRIRCGVGHIYQWEGDLDD